ncbi:hypothetical protein ACIQU5_36530 [Streptomyces sp. NPDC090306]|uniref:hypothetical protein n=1 Tax=Streptomyces sp. NPDC090306 TaxID=3365961 RepID=UPI0038111F6A
MGGPLDGLLLEVTGWPVGDADQGVALGTAQGLCGLGGRALYDPVPGDRTRMYWSGDTP